MECASGRYADKRGFQTCLACATGRYQELSGQKNCSECAEGKYNPNIEKTSGDSCESCSKGKYQTATGQSSCSTCEIGDRPVFAANATVCNLCPLNSQTTLDGDGCLCDVDFYAVEWNTTEEKPTAENIFQQVDPVGFADYQSDNQAINGQFAGYDVLQMFCPKCPEGADCQEAGTTINDVSPLEGYFPGSDNDGIISNVIFVACLNEACVGGVECADDDEFCYCAEDYTGQYCTFFFFFFFSQVDLTVG
jgi:hypothetical protein